MCTYLRPSKRMVAVEILLEGALNRRFEHHTARAHRHPSLEDRIGPHFRLVLKHPREHPIASSDLDVTIRLHSLLRHTRRTHLG